MVHATDRHTCTIHMITDQQLNKPCTSHTFQRALLLPHKRHRDIWHWLQRLCSKMPAHQPTITNVKRNNSAGYKAIIDHW